MNNIGMWTLKWILLLLAMGFLLRVAEIQESRGNSAACFWLCGLAMMVVFAPFAIVLFQAGTAVLSNALKRTNNEKTRLSDDGGAGSGSHRCNCGGGACTHGAGTEGDDHGS